MKEKIDMDKQQKIQLQRKIKIQNKKYRKQEKEIKKELFKEKKSHRKKQIEITKLKLQGKRNELRIQNRMQIKRAKANWKKLKKKYKDLSKKFKKERNSETIVDSGGNFVYNLTQFDEESAEKIVEFALAVHRKELDIKK